jgi:hypothetical protein
MSHSDRRHRELVDAIDHNSRVREQTAERTAAVTKAAAERSATASEDAAWAAERAVERQMELAQRSADEQAARMRQEVDRQRLLAQRETDARMRWLEFRDRALRGNPGLDDQTIELQFRRQEADAKRRAREHFDLTMKSQWSLLEHVALDDIRRDERTIRILGPASPPAGFMLPIVSMLAVQIVAALISGGLSLLSLVGAVLVGAWSVLRYKRALPQIVTKKRPVPTIKDYVLVAGKGLPFATVLAGWFTMGSQYDSAALMNALALLGGLAILLFGASTLFALKGGGMEEEKLELAQRKQDTAAYQAWLSSLTFEDWFEQGMPDIPHPPIVD